jgi:hypothetical protein
MTDTIEYYKQRLAEEAAARAELQRENAELTTLLTLADERAKLHEEANEELAALSLNISQSCHASTKESNMTRGDLIDLLQGGDYHDEVLIPSPTGGHYSPGSVEDEPEMPIVVIS